MKAGIGLAVAFLVLVVVIYHQGKKAGKNKVKLEHAEEVLEDVETANEARNDLRDDDKRSELQDNFTRE